MDDVCEGKNYSFPNEEQKVLHLWDQINAFKTQLALTSNLPEYVFYDGPPFATGLPHYGHILAGTIKDVVTRYQSTTGHHVTRRFGWDCHGVPVEHEIDTNLGIKSKSDVIAMGIDKYNEECRSIVTRYVGEWEKVVTRTGRWIDFNNGYKTMDLKYMESVWWVFGQLYYKGLVYRGFKVMPYSTGLKTPLSNFEANLNYKEVPDPEIMVTFPIVGDSDNASFVAWTTTPWTLPSNLALCVNKNMDYVKVRSKTTGSVFMVAESRLSQLPKEKEKTDTAPNGSASEAKTVKPKSKGAMSEKTKKPADDGYELLQKVKGSTLVGTKYVPLFDYFIEFSDVAFKVVADDYVTDDSGTGIVHCAPAFGEDDYRVCLANQIIEKGADLIVAVDDDGRFVEKVSDFKGRYVKEADKDIINAVKQKGRLLKQGNFTHSYPFCWRSETPLIYRAVPSWFVSVEKIKDQLLENNKLTYWVPDFVKEKRFHNWLENARDWAVSRSRFWGTPLPVWISEDGEEKVVMDSIEKLERLSGEKVTDLHSHKIDHITIPSGRGPEYGVLRRVKDVFDCWFESGSMPYAYIHYPFENVELFENNFPGHFVAEGLDQTRGWFYTLMVLSTALFGKPAFQNLICNGLVLAEDGKKMSKRLKNYPPPTEILDEYGADALRLYLINSPVVRAEPLRFKKDGVYSVVKDVFLPWYNAYRFLVQNAKRLEIEGFGQFTPVDHSLLESSSNVLDQWINSATRSLVHFVRQEMDAYRLYTVVPYLLKFLDNLTNIYVRLNRKRLKGRTGEEDCKTALSTLYHVLLTSCKAMAPFTPFFTETLYQNLRKVNKGAEESIHHCWFPLEEGKREDRIEQSVSRMMTVIDLARNIRERHNKPLKTPLREMVVVHPDNDFLQDITGKLKEYVLEELNVKSVVPCNDPLKYASLRAEPDFSALGKRLGKSMNAVSKEVKAMSQEEILAFEKAEEVTIALHCLKLSDIKVIREFKPPKDISGEEIDAKGDGDVLVVMDLRPDESLFEAGIAREVVNRIQKLRKKAGLEPTDSVEVYIKPSEQDSSVLQQVLKSQESYIREAISSPLLPYGTLPTEAVILCEETFHGISNMSFSIILSRTALVFSSNGRLKLFEGNLKYVQGLEVYLQSRDYNKLKSEFQAGNGKCSDFKMSITKPFKKPSSVVLDLDGTLLNTDGIVRDILKVILSNYGKKWDGREVSKTVGRTPLESYAVVVEEYNLPCTTDELLSEMNPAFLEQCRKIRALPGANRLIKHLSSNNVPMALASNSSKEDVELKISFHPGWKQSFSVIVGGDEVTNGKPSPEIFLEAAKRLSVEPPGCLVIEDSVSGVMAGKAAGMKVTAIPSIPKQTHLYTSVADEVINSLYDFRPELWGLPPFEDWVNGTLPIEPWCMGGPVVKGFGRGSKVLGIPTANLSTEGYSELLSEHPSGVFFGWAGLPTRGVYKMVMSIGWNPFFNNSEKTIEPWLLHDFGEDFYGEELRLVVVGYIRPEANFPSLESLVARIHEDGDIASRALDLPQYTKHKNDALTLT